MGSNRASRAKVNIVVSLGCQLISIACGLIIPRMMLRAFGSEIYGATTSIAQFLSYITLLEGGIGGVARAALYQPLASEDWDTVSAIVDEIKRFFCIISYIFAGYVIVIACAYKQISSITVLDWISTFMLVIIISISTFGQYFIGISYSVFLQAAQRSYVGHVVSIIATVINAVMVVLLIHLGCGILAVKAVSSLIFFLRPVFMWIYVKKMFPLVKHPAKKREKVYLKQKWEGLAQHLAFFLHSNTDVVVLTVLTDLKTVAVYSAYHMVTVHIQNLVKSFISGLEALFGDMLAKKETETIHKTFNLYETLISVVSIILFGVTSAMIVPFIRLYTAGVNDTNYIVPQFGFLLIAATLLYCLRMPYYAVVVAAGHFKETKAAAYGEAVINILLSVLLVHRFGLIGVAIGTVVATGYSFVYYVIYLSKSIIHRSVWLFIKRISVNALTIGMIYFVGSLVSKAFTIRNYQVWLICSVFVTLAAIVITGCVYMLVYRGEFVAVMQRYRKKRV